MVTGADHLVLCWSLAYGYAVSAKLPCLSAALSPRVQGEHRGDPRSLPGPSGPAASALTSPCSPLLLPGKSVSAAGGDLEESFAVRGTSHSL